MLLDIKKICQEYKIEINGLIHIGAHVGQEFNLYNQLNIEYLIFVEPQKILFDKLYSNIPRSPKIKLYNLALGNIVGKKTMYIDSNNQASSSLLKPKMHLKQYPNIRFNEEIEVKVEKLDNIIDNNYYNCINIDVQGYELEVFKGAKKVLNNIDYIFSEVNRDEVYEGCAKVKELDKYLLTYNFKRVETNWKGKTWGDAFYIKVDESLISKNNFEIKRELIGLKKITLFNQILLFFKWKIYRLFWR